MDASDVNHGFLRAPDGAFTTFDAPNAGTAPGQGTIPVCNNPVDSITEYDTLTRATWFMGSCGRGKPLLRVSLLSPAVAEAYFVKDVVIEPTLDCLMRIATTEIVSSVFAAAPITPFWNLVPDFLQYICEWLEMSSTRRAESLGEGSTVRNQEGQYNKRKYKHENIKKQNG